MIVALQQCMMLHVSHAPLHMARAITLALFILVRSCIIENLPLGRRRIPAWPDIAPSRVGGTAKAKQRSSCHKGNIAERGEG
jgi:hypothetical protein